MITYKNLNINDNLNIEISKLRFFSNNISFDYFTFVHFSCLFHTDICGLMIENYEINNNQIKINIKMKNIIESLNSLQYDEDILLDFRDIIYKIFIIIDNAVFYGYYSPLQNEKIDKETKKFINVRDIIINGILR